MRFAFVGFFFCTLLLSISPVSAQQLRYMDSAGNIHFVDSLSQVPRRYRDQIVTPTPVPVLDKKALAEKRRQDQRAQQEKMAEEKRKRAEELQKKREEARRKKDESKRNESKGRSSGFGRVL